MNLPSALRKILAGDKLGIDFFVPPKKPGRVSHGFDIVQIHHSFFEGLVADLTRPSHNLDG
jgi:hypothetical protein